MKFHEHDIIILTKPVKGLVGQPLPAGLIGTIDHRDKAFEVEFSINGVATVDVTQLRPEATCVYCGCTDSRACAGGCSWIELHRHTPTGICSNCIPRASAKAIAVLRRQKTCLEKRVRQMEKDRRDVRRGLRVIQLAKRVGGTDWNHIQLRRAVKAWLEVEF